VNNQLPKAFLYSKQMSMKKLLSLFAILVSFYQINAQNVGIGTTTPLARLHVKDSSVLFSGVGAASGSDNPPISGAGKRMMWYARKAAFRAGYVTDTQWDKDSVGSYSIAAGYNTIAKGPYSVSMGYTSYALSTSSIALGSSNIASGYNSVALGAGAESTGDYSISIGQNTVASGVYSTVMGQNADATGQRATAIGNYPLATGSNSMAIGYLDTASGNFSTAMGYAAVASGSSSISIGNRSKASGDYSTSFGYETEASSLYATAIGRYTLASGNTAIAIGYNTIASGSNATAIGNTSVAQGNNSVAIGLSTIARSYASTVIGRFNDSIAGSSLSGWNSEDPLFIIGNGVSDNVRSNALTVLKNANMGISTTSPKTQLDVNGDVAFRQNPNVGIITSIITNNMTTGSYSFLYIDYPTAFTITGIANGYDGKILTILNTSAQNMTIANLNAGSDPQNRINTLSGADIVTNGNGSVTLQYSIAHNRWMVIAVRD
jgi:Head domain of trimeric autotransporter adhesin